MYPHQIEALHTAEIIRRALVVREGKPVIMETPDSGRSFDWRAFRFFCDGKFASVRKVDVEMIHLGDTNLAQALDTLAPITAQIVFRDYRADRSHFEAQKAVGFLYREDETESFPRPDSHARTGSATQAAGGGDERKDNTVTLRLFTDDARTLQHVLERCILGTATERNVAKAIAIRLEAVNG